MNRRGFFGVTLGAFAAVVMPRRVLVSERVNVPYEDYCDAINKATFKFWRNANAPANGAVFYAYKTSGRFHVCDSRVAVRVGGM